jgi:spermidine/putrescine transport system ATP-binding protein
MDVAIAEGEFFSLLGPSGCGKTTTMRIIAGFEDPTQGTVHLHGADVTLIPPHKRDVNMVFQSYALFPHMNVFDNVAFGLRRKKTDKKEVEQRVTEILGIVGLEGYAKRRPRQMSGGQQQRVALARALVNRPRALLLDEPLGALDLKLRQAMQIELKRIQREVGITFVYVTHDQGEALTMSDRIAVMNEGVIEQLAQPRDIYEHPKTRFVAGFIGTSNLLGGTVTRTEAGSAVIEFGDGERIIVPEPDARPGDKLEITVRPEKMTLTAGDMSNPARGAAGGAAGAGSRRENACALRGTVTEVVYLGTSTNFNVTTSAGAEVVVFSQNTSAEEQHPPQRGDAVWLLWDPANSYPIGSPQ